LGAITQLKNEGIFLKNIKIINDGGESCNEDKLSRELLLEEDSTNKDYVIDDTLKEINDIISSKKTEYVVLPNGERILYHFTTKNSPLPSDNITDIQINGKTGKVYFASENGIVSYLGNNVDTKDRTKFGNVLVYPNPVIYNQFKNDVTIKGLAEKTNIKITDTAGNLVHQAVARGGFYTWDLTNDYGQRVASGIYFVLMTNEDGSDTATAKIAVVN